MESLYCCQQCWPLPMAAFQIRCVDSDSKQHLQTFLKHIQFQGTQLTRACLYSSGVWCHHSLQKCKVWFSYNHPRGWVRIYAKGEGWFIAAHSAPKEVSGAHAEPFHIAIVRRTLQVVLIAKADLSLSWGWWWMFPLEDLGSLEKYGIW